MAGDKDICLKGVHAFLPTMQTYTFDFKGKGYVVTNSGSGDLTKAETVTIDTAPILAGSAAYGDAEILFITSSGLFNGIYPEMVKLILGKKEKGEKGSARKIYANREMAVYEVSWSNSNRYSFQAYDLNGDKKIDRIFVAGMQCVGALSFLIEDPKILGDTTALSAKVFAK